jgi:hypothetical protein
VHVVRLACRCLSAAGEVARGGRVRGWWPCGGGSVSPWPSGVSPAKAAYGERIPRPPGPPKSGLYAPFWGSPMGPALGGGWPPFARAVMLESRPACASCMPFAATRPASGALCRCVSVAPGFGRSPAKADHGKAFRGPAVPPEVRPQARSVPPGGAGSRRGVGDIRVACRFSSANVCLPSAPSARICHRAYAHRIDGRAVASAHTERSARPAARSVRS